ncbi:hypothetical protein AX15_006174 [Amanita polypyramis BW_CC]|nr:hypothetical protein AX15_006174 [Amanita polypyramis BW_CC]
MPHQGHCLCGGSKVFVDADPTFNIVCHCEDCRRCNGTAFSSQVLVPAKSAKVEGTYTTTDVKALSGNVVTRWFCASCGSHLMHRSDFLGENICVQTGNVDAFIKLPVGMEIFTKDRWPSVKPMEGAKQIDCMPPKQ